MYTPPPAAPPAQNTPPAAPPAQNAPAAARIAALAELASEHAMTDGMEQLLAHFMPMVQAFIAVASTALDSMPEDVKAELDAMKAPALAEPTADGDEAPKRRAKAAAAAAATAATNKTL